MTLPALPATFIEELEAACEAVNVPGEPIARAITRLVGCGKIDSYYIWQGPGIGQDADLILDVLVLGNRCLYSYVIRKTISGEMCLFLDNLQSVAITTTGGEPVYYVLGLLVPAQTVVYRIYGRREDHERLFHFRGTLIHAILRAKHPQQGT